MLKKRHRVMIWVFLAAHIALAWLGVYLILSTVGFAAITVVAAQIVLLIVTRRSFEPLLRPIPKRTASSRSGEPAVEAYFRVRGEVADRYQSGTAAPPEVVAPVDEIARATQDSQVVQSRIAAGFADAAPVARTIERLQAVLEREQIDHIFISGVATMVYCGRTPTDVDLCVCDAGRARFEEVAVGLLVRMRPGLPGSYVDLETGVAIDMILAGKPIDDLFNAFPSPQEAITLGGLPVPRVERQVGLLLALGRDKDFDAVQQILTANKFDERFAGLLPIMLRERFHAANANGRAARP